MPSVPSTSTLRVWRLLAALAASSCNTAHSPPASAKLRLEGVGLVGGLDGTGSNDAEVLRALQNFMRQPGLSIEDLVAGVAAMVNLTCDLPEFAELGRVVDVRCEIRGAATSLRGGELVRAELRSPDGKVYVVAGGPIVAMDHSVGVDSAKESQPRVTGWRSSGVIVRTIGRSAPDEN